ncbi:OCIA domain-containing protein 1 isoform X2 [Protopterus annectens]|nr:OCIA domain-containing protein 1 isoform X2 [Protopterus annectens]
MQYVPTEEERRTFKECNQESFWYRSLPFSAISMFVTQGLISKGVLSTSARFGSIPKVAFAGIFGYLAGKLSYTKTCQEKFKRLENSPLGEALRRGQSRHPAQYSFHKTDLNGEGTQASATALAPSAVEGTFPEYSEVPFSASISESSTTGIDDFSSQAPAQHFEPEAEQFKRKPVTYEELRSKNRETYEVTVTQKAETPHRPVQERVPKKEVNTNKYGDVWED